jgi:hypothetical protein
MVRNGMASRAVIRIAAPMTIIGRLAIEVKRRLPPVVTRFMRFPPREDVT